MVRVNVPQRAMSSEVVVSFKDVTFEYAHDRPLMTSASFNIREGNKVSAGERICDVFEPSCTSYVTDMLKVTIMGQNGSGKSTIIKLINGVLQPNEGSIHIKRGAVVATAMQVL